MTDSSGNWTIWLSRALFNPWFRLAYAACAAAGVGACVAADWDARFTGTSTPWAPEAADLWLAIGLGFGVGVVFAALERFQLTRRREQSLAFHRAPYHERMRREHQRPNLPVVAGLLVMFCALWAWCLVSHTSIYPATFAAMVPFALNLRLAARFGRELRARATADDATS